LLFAVLALLVGYLIVLRLRRRYVMRFANLGLLERVAPKRQGWARHVPTALLLVALVGLTVALAGPTAQHKVPRNRATVMLAIDVSLSMDATGVAPTRLKAAQAAGKAFIDGLTPGVNLGVVAFAGTATVLVSPTADRAAPTAAIDNLKLAERTATGRRTSPVCRPSTPSPRCCPVVAPRRRRGSWCYLTGRKRCLSSPTTPVARSRRRRRRRRKRSGVDDFLRHPLWHREHQWDTGGRRCLSMSPRCARSPRSPAVSSTPPPVCRT